MLRRILIVAFLVSVPPVHSWPFCSSRKVNPELSGVDASFLKKLTKKLNISEPLRFEPENSEQVTFLRLFGDLWSVKIRATILQVFSFGLSCRGAGLPKLFAKYSYSMGFACGVRGENIEAAQRCYSFFLCKGIHLFTQKNQDARLLLSFVSGILDGYSYSVVAPSKVSDFFYSGEWTQRSFIQGFERNSAVDDSRDLKYFVKSYGNFSFDSSKIAFFSGVHCLEDMTAFKELGDEYDMSLNARTSRITGLIERAIDVYREREAARTRVVAEEAAAESKAAYSGGTGAGGPDSFYVAGVESYALDLPKNSARRLFSGHLFDGGESDEADTAARSGIIHEKAKVAGATVIQEEWRARQARGAALAASESDDDGPKPSKCVYGETVTYVLNNRTHTLVDDEDGEFYFPGTIMNSDGREVAPTPYQQKTFPEEIIPVSLTTHETFNVFLKMLSAGVLYQTIVGKLQVYIKTKSGASYADDAENAAVKGVLTQLDQALKHVHRKIVPSPGELLPIETLRQIDQYVECLRNGLDLPRMSDPAAKKALKMRIAQNQKLMVWVARGEESAAEQVEKEKKAKRKRKEKERVERERLEKERKANRFLGRLRG